MSHMTRRRKRRKPVMTGLGWGGRRRFHGQADWLFFLSYIGLGRGSQRRLRLSKKKEKNFAGDPTHEIAGDDRKEAAKKQDVDHAITEKKSKSHFRNWKWEINFV